MDRAKEKYQFVLVLDKILERRETIIENNLKDFL